MDEKENTEQADPSVIDEKAAGLVQKLVEAAKQPGGPELQQPGPQPKSFQQRFAEFAAPIINCNIRGLLAVTIGAPFNIVAVGICNIFGQVISSMTAVGMLNDVLKLRGECRDAFNKGLDSMVPQAPPQAPPQGQDLKTKLMNGGVRG